MRAAIHPFIVCTVYSGIVTGSWSLIPTDRVKAGYALDRSSVYHRADTHTHTDVNKLTLTFMATGNLESPSPERPYCSCLWLVGGSQSSHKEPTQAHGEHAASTQKGPRLRNRAQSLLGSNHCTTFPVANNMVFIHCLMMMNVMLTYMLT